MIARIGGRTAQARRQPNEAIRLAGAARCRKQSAVGLRHESELATGTGRSERLRQTEADSERPEAARLLDYGHRYASEE